MPSEPRQLTAQQQSAAIGAAVKALRERAGMTQDQAGEALGVTRQAWQQYETAGKPVLLRSDMQDRLAKALGVTREDLLRERDRQAGIDAPVAEPPPGSRSAIVCELPVMGRVRAGEAGPQIYDLAEPESFFDTSWMFRPTVRSLRVAGDAMSGYVESGQLVIYDTSVWPRRGDGCVVELVSGDVHVVEYEGAGQGVLRVRQRFPEETISFPMNEVKGVYLIRFRGQ